MGFINGTCVRATYLASAPLLEQWNKCNAVVLNWILSSLSQDVYLGHVFFDNAESVWKELQKTYDRIDGSIVFNLAELIDHAHKEQSFTREIIPEVKDAFVIVAREESHIGIPPSSTKSNKPQASVSVSRTNDVKRNNSNANWNNGNMSNNNGNRGNYNNLICKNYGLKGPTIKMCFEIIGYPTGFKRNPNLKINGNFNNNKSNNADSKGNSMGNNKLKTPIGTLSFTNEKFLKLMNLLNDKSDSTAHANVAGSSVCPFS
ncbi:hypothetical protein Tco_0451998 [Tanacetum coccineum]